MVLKSKSPEVLTYQEAFNVNRQRWCQVTDRIVTEYLKARERDEKGARSPYVKFTLAKLKDLPEKPFDYEVRALDPLSGLICRVRKSGVKTLEVFKKPSGSHRPVRIKIGTVGDLHLTGPGKSVKKRLQVVLSDLEGGINPNAERKSRRLKEEGEKLTLSEALDTYISSVRLKESTAQSYRNTIENNLEDEQESQLSDLLNKQLLFNLQSRITKKAGPYAANATMRVLRAVANASREDLADDSGDSPIPPWPIKGRRQVKKFWNPTERRTGWIKPEYLKDWWKATEALPNEYEGNGELARDYLQFVLLSGLRRREATSLRWEDIDFKVNSFKITDTKNNKGLELPCSDYMMKILKRRKGESVTGPFELKEPKKMVAWVRGRSGVEFMIHDLRRSFITYAESLDFGGYTIKALVNHSLGNSRDVTEGYMQLSVERLRKPMQEITRYVLAKAKSRSVVRIGGRKDGSM